MLISSFGTFENQSRIKDFAEIFGGKIKHLFIHGSVIWTMVLYRLSHMSIIIVIIIFMAMMGFASSDPSNRRSGGGRTPIFSFHDGVRAERWSKSALKQK